MFNKKILNLILIIILIVCLWIGWGDFDFTQSDMTQQEIRDSIREHIRRAIQIAIQFVIPIAILGYFIKELFGKRDS